MRRRRRTARARRHHLEERLHHADAGVGENAVQRTELIDHSGGRRLPDLQKIAEE
jgi:hypothetical protein